MLFIDTQPRQRIEEWSIPPYPTWIAEATILSLNNITTVHVAEGEPLPNTLNGIDGIIGGGSGHSVTEALPWMTDTATFLDKAHQAGTPELLICFCHQLKARANTEEPDNIEELPDKRFGLLEVTLTPQGRGDPLSDDLSDTFPVFTSNRLVVPRTPERPGYAVSEFGRSQHPNEMLVYQREDFQDGPDSKKPRVVSV